MKLYFYRGPQPNFGDELNEWMWQRLLPGAFDHRDDEIFLGIGSILFADFPAAARKIVFGAGYGGYTPVPRIDANWQIYFVRGRLTAKALGLDASYAVGDAAILLRSCVGEPPPKRFKASFVPHWESAIDGAWERVCRLAGVHYIDPRESVDTVLMAIRQSEVVIAEAMHGAIVSDAMRVPWVPVRPIQGKHRMKWHDWASALDIDLRPHQMPPSSAFEAALTLVSDNKKNLDRLHHRGQGLRRVLPSFFAERAARRLRELTTVEPSLSSDEAMTRAHGRMLEHLDALCSDRALKRAA